EKSFQDQTIAIYEFMAKMLFFLPDPNQKMIRYYGIYSNRIMVRHACLDAAAHQPDNSVLSQRTWAQAIENSFDAKPQHCPDCTKNPLIPLQRRIMRLTVVYSYSARKTIEGLKETHTYMNGYFRPKSRAP
ncbi:MAG TPA: transposase, partial [Leptospiraceae bacterium]|nr:transposase [Leptospiraceae bacterium]HNG98212.1 transposase [Leptospiraceae bacterium]